MLRSAWRLEAKILFRSTILSGRRSYSLQADSKLHDPLSILFCGADEFSIYSLLALRDLQNRRPDRIGSIDVLCRPDKRVGRGLKEIQQVPIKKTALDLGLSLHQIDSFRDWSPPASINLVIAVSFGLLVPARVLNGTKYGGLNVHPSLLPDLRGPAPIVHTLLKRRSHTGVTLQTMHPTQFDKGTILAQTPRPGVPVAQDRTPGNLLKSLGPLGAEMLCLAIENDVFVPPLKDIRSDMAETQQSDHAGKITPEDRRIDWNRWTSDEVLHRDRILGRLWDDETYSRCFPDHPRKRVLFYGPWLIQADVSISSTPGWPMLLEGEQNLELPLAIKTIDGKLVIPATATIEGEGKGKGLMTLVKGLCAG